MILSKTLDLSHLGTFFLATKMFLISKLGQRTIFCTESFGVLIFVERTGIKNAQVFGQVCNGHFQRRGGLSQQKQLSGKLWWKTSVAIHGPGNVPYRTTGENRVNGPYTLKLLRKKRVFSETVFAMQDRLIYSANTCMHHAHTHSATTPHIIREGKLCPFLHTPQVGKVPRERKE